MENKKSRIWHGYSEKLQWEDDSWSGTCIRKKDSKLLFQFRSAASLYSIQYNELNIFFFWGTGVAATNYDAFGGQIQVNIDDK